MAQRQTVTYISDLSGKDITDDDAASVSFSYDGSDYTIDLTSQEAEKFRSAIEPYVSAGTKVSKSGGRGRAKSKTNGGSNAAEIRAWAKSNGLSVPDRGRIPSEVREAFDAAK